MSISNPYFDEVIEAHRLIEQWLGEANAPGEIMEQLIGRFSAQYSMIGLAGNALDYFALCAFFRANGGAKSGLQIEVFDLQVVSQWETGAVILYKERQTLGESVTLRFSTIVFERNAQGKILWRHLHETSTAS